MIGRKVIPVGRDAVYESEGARGVIIKESLSKHAWYVRWPNGRENLYVVGNEQSSNSLLVKLVDSPELEWE
jgi:hypothetical protein